MNLNFKVYQYNYYIHVKLLRIKYPTDAIFHNVISIHNLHSQFKDILRHCLRLDIKTAIKAIKTDVLDYCIWFEASLPQILHNTFIRTIVEANSVQRHTILI